MHRTACRSPPRSAGRSPASCRRDRTDGPVRAAARVSIIADGGRPFFDAAADEALFASVRAGVPGDNVELVELDSDVNDDCLADAISPARLAGQIEGSEH